MNERLNTKLEESYDLYVKGIEALFPTEHPYRQGEILKQYTQIKFNIEQREALIEQRLMLSKQSESISAQKDLLAEHRIVLAQQGVFADNQTAFLNEITRVVKSHGSEKRWTTIALIAIAIFILAQTLILVIPLIRSAIDTNQTELTSHYERSTR